MRILIIEDDVELGRSMVKSLLNAGYAADWVTNLGDALHSITISTFEAIALDLGLPDGNGYDVLRSLRQQGNSTPVLILTARDAVEDRVQGLDLGADDYAVKPLAMQEFHARLRALIRRSSRISSSRFNIGRIEIDIAEKQAFINGRLINLPRREWGVLEYLAINSRRIVSKDQLIQAITAQNEELSENAIEAYVHRIREKIKDSEVHIRTIRGLGYMLELLDE